MENLILKKELSNHELHLLGSEMEKRKKSTVVTWLLWLFLGGFGGHRCYLGRVGSGVAMTLTLGGLGIWALIDAFFINGMLKKKNEEIEATILQEIKQVNQKAAL
ncbi:TM2 domain-containing protein [Pseudalkalibacillus sp. A8]|uniref:TM2 domain-containing protein n=1 Tax=Pseudalkalibacillus sp. A8 TaxID=3382641 RepID=UPI0038B55C67